MFLISCPWCGERDQSEFSCHGEAHIVRPPQPHKLSDREWGDYVFFRSNPRGVHLERWVHSHGCRRWFNVARDTSTDYIYGSYQVGESPPIAPESAPPTAAPSDAQTTDHAAAHTADQKAKQNG